MISILSTWRHEVASSSGLLRSLKRPFGSLRLTCYPRYATAARVTCCFICSGTSAACQHAVLLQQVLAPYMDLHTLLKARGACKAWAKTWGAYVPGISLEQPLSVAAARSMGSKGAASFPCAVKARITVTSADFTKAALWDAVSAAKALVCQLQLPALRTLHVAWGADFSCSGWVLRQVLPQLPAQQLQVLDLSEAYLLPHLLRLIAAHLTQLQRLVLPDTYMVWNDADLASLAAVSTLRELICHPRPPMSGGQGASWNAKPRHFGQQHSTSACSHH